MTERSSVALVLAAGDGIGAAIVRRFARGGYHTVIVRRDVARSDELVASLTEEGHKLSVLSADVRNEDLVKMVPWNLRLLLTHFGGYTTNRGLLGLMSWTYAHLKRVGSCVVTNVHSWLMDGRLLAA